MKTTLRILFITLLVFTFQTTLLGQIQSTTAGGDWQNASTWVGNTVPTANDDVVINGTVVVENTQTTSGAICNNLTIASTGILENKAIYYSVARYVVVNGNFVNNGVVRNHTSGSDRLVVYLKGNATINNDLTCERIDFAGTGVQNISLASGKYLGCTLSIENTASIPTATSNLNFDFTNYVPYYRMMYGEDLIFNMNNYDLSATGNTDLNYSNDTPTIKNAKRFSTSENIVFENITFDGNVIFDGTVTIEGNVKVTGNLTVDGILQNAGIAYSVARYVIVEGDLINNGTLRNHPSGSDRLYITLLGNLTNNNIMDHELIEFNASGVQNITVADNKSVSCTFNIKNSESIPTALSDIHFDFTNHFPYYKAMDGENLLFDMNNHSIKITGDGYFGYSDNTPTIKNINNFESSSSIKLYYVNFDGDVNFKGTVNIESNVNVNGNLTVIDTLQNVPIAYSVSRKIGVTGDLTVNETGVIRDHLSGSDRLVPEITGNIVVNGICDVETINFKGNQTRTVDGSKFASKTELTILDKTSLTGDNIVPKIYVNSGAVLTLNSGATLLVTGELRSPYGEFVNNGKYTINAPVTSSGYKDFHKVNINIDDQLGYDTINVTSYGNQTPETFGNAYPEYWEITPNNDIETNSSRIRFYYTEANLGTNSEEELNIFHSTDSGSTWQQLSVPSNSYISTTYDYIELNDAPLYGQYCISSNSDAYSIRPSVILSVIGRENLRVGPPNTYTFNYVNNSDVPTNELIIMVTTGGEGVFIEKIIPSVPYGVEKQEIPIDSLTYEGKQDTVLLCATSMAPREERSFDVVFRANTEGILGKSTHKDPQLVFSVGGMLAYAASAVVVTYVKDVGMNFAEEIWRPVAPCETVGQALYGAIKDSWSKANKKWWGAEKPARAILDQASDDVLAKVGVKIPGKDLVDATGRTVKGMNRYLNNDFKVKDCSGKERKINGEGGEKNKNVEKVTSWDPNEKTGPDGYGDLGHITTAGKMQYKIFFENKAEAQAPAWKIVIRDTLSEFLDPSTIKIGETSHEGDNYDWNITISDNIITWDIEDIELPPNVTPPEGEGWVSFTVNAKSDLASGTEIRNKATIVFDLNDPITTNEVVNTLDYTAPVTTMTELPTKIEAEQAVIKWDSTDPDNGSGIESTTVYGSINDGPYYSFGSTSADSLIVTLNDGAKYSFYALSKDNVGNVENTINTPVEFFAYTAVEDLEIPKNYSLEQNYPNPFNPSTKINFNLPYTSEVKISVFNVLGQTVEILKDEILDQGNYTIIWDASKYASGVYFYKIKAISTSGNQEYSNVKKMLLIK